MYLKITDLEFNTPTKSLFRNVNLEIEISQFYLCGANGAGKSTLLKILSGLEMGYTGTIEIDGKNIRDESLFFLVHQQPLLLENASIKRNIDVLSDNIEYSKKIFTNMYSQIKLNTKVSKLSGGQKQLLHLALGLGSASKYIAIDEPYNNLDIEKVEYIMKEIKNNPKVKLIVSHTNKNEVNKLIIKNGEVMYEKY